MYTILDESLNIIDETKAPTLEPIKWRGRGISLVLYKTRDHNPPHLHIFRSDGKPASENPRDLQCRMAIPRYVIGSIREDVNISLEELVFFSVVSLETAKAVLGILNDTRNHIPVWKIAISKWRFINRTKPTFMFKHKYHFVRKDRGNYVIEEF